MSMSTFVCGERDLSRDSEFDKMLSLLLSCREAGIKISDYPQKLTDYFGDAIDIADEENIRREMASIDITDAIKEVSDCGDMRYEVDLSKLPKECVKVVFSNSW